ncbi:MAG: hypothetical protein HY052_01705 [Proteobacteria bacterium]|nr:hypothetical protein [Pseudomonadota bacterium]
MHTNTEKITKEFCQGKTLSFKPKTEAEAVFIQRQLLGFGYRWVNSGHTIIEPKECLKNIRLKNGILYTDPADKGDLLCSSDQFQEKFDPNDPKNLSGDTLVQETFNRLSGRIETLETKIDALTSTMNEILAELRPKRLDKPTPRTPKGGL